jgi:hypothetical protein
MYKESFLFNGLYQLYRLGDSKRMIGVCTNEKYILTQDNQILENKYNMQDLKKVEIENLEDISQFPGIFKNVERICLQVGVSFVKKHPEWALLNYMMPHSSQCKYVLSGVLDGRPYFMADHTSFKIKLNDISFNPSLIKDERIKIWHIMFSTQNTEQMCAAHNVTNKWADWSIREKEQLRLSIQDELYNEYSEKLPLITTEY